MRLRIREVRCEWIQEDFAVRNGRIIGTGPGYRGREEIDLRSSPVVPGFIDAHVHVESSLLTPYEYGRLVMKHGTTTVIADPHEIANVCGRAGIEYMLKAHEQIPLDLLIMLPSCVPATPDDECMEVLTADLLRPFIGRDGVIGLGEMMNVPGVLGGDPCVMEKIGLSPIRDGHAPLLGGSSLDEYIAAGLESDHESAHYEEGREKLRKGMYLFIREGSTERNLKTLIPVVTGCSVSRCCFCTDDRHADMLVQSGHIDDCIRKAIAEGCEPEFAYRMASLTAANRFGLNDRGALSPGRLADFCILEDINSCRVTKTYKRGRIPAITDFKPATSAIPSQWPFHAGVPSCEDIRITGEGYARVVRIQEGQIGTKKVLVPLSAGEIPDTTRDILKLVVISRYTPQAVSIGLVQGLGLKKGAIASSVSHDSHNVIAAGTNDADIIAAIRTVVHHKGAMVICDGDRQASLPLPIGGLMSDLSYEEVKKDLDDLHQIAADCESVRDPFMYLSFLALSVIPEIRVTTRGVFDVNAFAYVPLFTGENEKS